MSDAAPAGPWVVSASGRRIVVRETAEGPRLPGHAGRDALEALAEFTMDVSVGRERVGVIVLPDEAVLPEGLAFSGLRAYFAAATARSGPSGNGGVRLEVEGRLAHVAQWAAATRFCGRCGGPTAAEDGPEPALRCTGCGWLHFPRISPAVIVAVEHAGRLLLGRAGRFPRGGWSVLAGFVEPGESLEGAVAREVREEVGVDVAGIRYFGSQPWPFPDSLMVGFAARALDDALDVDGIELVEAAWFEPHTLPPVPPRFSIARALIDDWVRRRGGDPDALETWEP